MRQTGFSLWLGRSGHRESFFAQSVKRCTFNLQQLYLNERELTAHMNDNFETPCRQLFGQPWDIFWKTLTQLRTTLRDVPLPCPMGSIKPFFTPEENFDWSASYVLPPFSEETAWHQGLCWGPPQCLAIGHQAPGKVAQIGRWGRGISLSPSDWRISPNLMALWTKVTKGEDILLFIRLRLKRQRCFLLFCWLEDFEIIKALSIEKRPPDVSKIVPCTIDCYDTFWPVAFALAFYREGISKKYNLRCALWFMELLLDIVMDGYWRFHRIWVDQFGGKQLSYPVPGQGEKTPVVTGWVSKLCS